jgi:4-aminobutyrate aminotransferase / (S)-3-amino-2-methylpropionate transaminase / 5-aminovalerate transaminase
VVETKHRKVSDDFSLQDTFLTKKKQDYESIALGDQLPIIWDRAKDFYVYDNNGNKWIDMTAGIFVSNAGHSNPKIVKAIKKQADKLIFAFLYNTEIRYEFIERLLEISPDHFEKAVLLSSGSEVTDIASKLIKFWAKKNNRKHIVAFRGSYHGRTLGSDFLCGNEGSTDWCNMKDDDMVFLDFPYENEKFDPSKLPEPNSIAAFFLETYQGWGAWMYPNEYIKDLYDFAKKHGILICFDEIQSGFYRMGELYGYMTYGDYIKPDLICLGKGISSSLPMSAVLGTKELIDVDENAIVGGTHSGNALCCAASLANINFLTEKKFQKSLHKKNKLFDKLSRNLVKYNSITHINTRGMVTGIIFENKEIATNVVKKCISKGVLPVCTFKNAIKLGPPLTITISAIKEAMEVIRESIEEAESEQKSA